MRVFRIGDIGYSGAGRTADKACSTEFPALDRELAGGGWSRGDLTEILCDGGGMGELSLLLPALARMRSHSSQQSRQVRHVVAGPSSSCVWIAPPYLPYAPALMAAGVDLTQLFIVDIERTEDALWAAEQSLASGAAECVCIWISSAIGNTPMRRLKHAAMAGGAICWLMRPTAFAQHASPASVRIALTANVDGSLTLNLIKRRGLPPNKQIHLLSRELPCLALHRRRQSVPVVQVTGAAATPLREWLDRTFGEAVMSSTSVRHRSMSPDR
jgi:cell division inhibitor SulA/protein ImuA